MSSAAVESRLYGLGLLTFLARVDSVRLSIVLLRYYLYLLLTHLGDPNLRLTKKVHQILTKHIYVGLHLKLTPNATKFWKISIHFGRHKTTAVNTFGKSLLAYC